MKKILFGIVAVSCITFSAAPTAPVLSDKAAQDTPIFNQAQNGKLDITGVITSDVPVVKYALFGSTGDGLTVGEINKTTLDLPLFVISKNAGVSGFQDTVPKAYLRLITGNGAKLEEIPENQTVEFKIEFDSGYTGLNRVLNVWSNNINTDIAPWSLVPKSVIDPLVENIRPDSLGSDRWMGTYVFDNGILTIDYWLGGDGSWAVYPFSKSIHIESNKGVLIFSDGSNYQNFPYTKYTTQPRYTITDNEASQFDTALSEVYQAQNVKIYARVK